MHSGEILVCYTLYSIFPRAWKLVWISCYFVDGMYIGNLYYRRLNIFQVEKICKA